MLRRLIETETQDRERLEELVAERTRQLETSLEQLRHSERLASVGTLAAGIAHEINNPVGMILLSAEQLLVSMPASPDKVAAPVVQDIIDNAKRCGQIVKSVLRFARQCGPPRSGQRQYCHWRRHLTNTASGNKAGRDNARGVGR